jgi:hypothetical protein
MPQHASEGANSPDEDDEIIRLARKFTELHYQHDLHIDIDALRADILQRVPIAAPPPQTRFQQVRVSISRARQQVSWDWRAPIRRPYAIPLAFFIGTIATIALLVIGDPLVVHYFAHLMPEKRSAQQAAEISTPFISPSPARSHKRPAAAQATTNQTYGTQSAPRLPANNSTTGKPTSIDITVGSPSGSLISLNVTLTSQGNGGIGLGASLGVTIDPAEAVCRLEPLGNGNPHISQLLAELRTPVNVQVATGPDHLVVQMSPTGVRSQPLNCSVLSSNAQPGLPADSNGTSPTAGTSGTDPAADVGSTGSLSRTAGKVLGTVISISPSGGPIQSSSSADLDPAPLPVLPSETSPVPTGN